MGGIGIGNSIQSHGRRRVRERSIFVSDTLVNRVSNRQQVETSQGLGGRVEKSTEIPNDRTLQSLGRTTCHRQKWKISFLLLFLRRVFVWGLLLLSLCRFSKTLLHLFPSYLHDNKKQNTHQTRRERERGKGAERGKSVRLLPPLVL